jgi:hypothetical protein
MVLDRRCDEKKNRANIPQGTSFCQETIEKKEKRK